MKNDKRQLAHAIFIKGVRCRASGSRSNPKRVIFANDNDVRSSFPAFIQNQDVYFLLANEIRNWDRLPVEIKCSKMHDEQREMEIFRFGMPMSPLVMVTGRLFSLDAQHDTI